MTLTSQNSIGFVLAILVSVVLSTPLFVGAQTAVSLSVSPTLFEMTASPTQVWSSSIRVINANEFPIQIYTDVVNFEATGEAGEGRMSPVLQSETNNATLAEWITISTEDIVIPAEQTITIPFSIQVPDEAPPGGHFAAVLVGTKSVSETDGAAQVETSQVVTSLVFLSVAGDVVEAGQIRDFSTDRIITESPKIEFSLRFENTGNVHLQPQGDITVTNMWGKERGVVPINRNSQFGNVLPESIRKYRFEWVGDWSFADIGRYTAVATLGYGENTRQFADAAVTFWVIPWRALLTILIIVGGLLYSIVWGIKLYIRRMLQLAGVTPELHRDTRHHKVKPAISITAPLEAGILDLRSELRSGSGTLLHRVTSFARLYKVFLLITIAVFIFVSLFVWYLVLALTSERGYEVNYEVNGEMITLPPETDNRDSDEEPLIVQTLPTIELVNRSGGPATADQVAELLRKRGYDVDIDTTKQAVVEDKTIIIYDPVLSEQVLRIQGVLPTALVSAYTPQEGESPVTIYIGSDQIQSQ